MGMLFSGKRRTMYDCGGSVSSPGARSLFLTMWLTLSIAAGACDEADRSMVIGQYALLTVNGVQVGEFTMTDPSGEPLTVDRGELVLCLEGRYRIEITQKYINSGRPQGIVASSGEYTWDGVTLLLFDSGGGSPVTALKSNGMIMVQIGGYEYAFTKLVRLPPFTGPTC
jgi:hypothetical protein